MERATKMLAVVLVAETAHGLQDESFTEVVLVREILRYPTDAGGQSCNRLARGCVAGSGHGSDETSGTGSGRTSQKSETP